AGEVGLIEVTGLVHRVQDRRTVAQQAGRVTRPFDLAEQPVGQPGGAPEATLHRADAERLRVPAYRGLHHLFPCDDAAPGELVDIAFRVLQIRQWPPQSVQLERSVGRHRLMYVVVVEQQTGRERGHVHAEPEPDRRPLTVGWAFDDGRPGLGPAHRHHG